MSTSSQLLDKKFQQVWEPFDWILSLNGVQLYQSTCKTLQEVNYERTWNYFVVKLQVVKLLCFVIHLLRFFGFSLQIYTSWRELAISYKWIEYHTIGQRANAIFIICLFQWIINDLKISLEELHKSFEGDVQETKPKKSFCKKIICFIGRIFCFIGRIFCFIGKIFFSLIFPSSCCFPSEEKEKNSTSSSMEKLNDRISMYVNIWVLAIIYYCFAYYFSYFEYYPDQFADSFSPSLYYFYGIYKMLDSLLFLAGWMSSNLLFICYIYEAYDEYDSKIHKDIDEMFSVTQLTSHSRPNQYNIQTPMPSYQSNQSTQQLGTPVPSGTDNLNKIESAHVILCRSKNLKAKLFHPISIFTFWWFVQAFGGTILRLTALLEEKPKEFESWARIFCYYIYGMSFIIFTVYVADNKKGKQEKRYADLKYKFQGMNATEVKEETGKNLLLKDLEDLKSIQPEVYKYFHLDFKLLLHFFGHAIPFTVYCRDLFFRHDTQHNNQTIAF